MAEVSWQVLELQSSRGPVYHCLVYYRVLPGGASSILASQLASLKIKTHRSFIVRNIYWADLNL